MHAAVVRLRLRQLGNLASQQEHAFAPGRTETFEYDTLHRLTRTTRSTMPQAEVIYGYDAAGNLTEKSDFAELYTYANDSNRLTETSKGAVTNADATYAYDGNGNQTERRGDSAQLTRLSTYDIHNRPERVRWTDQPSQFQGDLTFRYGPSGDRYLQRTGLPSGSGHPRLTLYPFKGYEIDGTFASTSTLNFNTVRQHLGSYGLRHSVYGGAEARTVWLHSDRLGSVVVKTNQDGTVAMNHPTSPNAHSERHGYDAFGKPRRGNWDEDATSGGQASAPGNKGVMRSFYTPRGFTGHEHLDDNYSQHRLTHMNGRMYDPLLGRFLGVDPIIQFPANGQSLNPYSYIMNNPMSGTDPTGYTCEPMVGSRICGVDTGGTIDGASVTATHMRVNQEERRNGASGGGGGVSSDNNRGGRRSEPSSINADSSRPSSGGGTPERDTAPRERDYTTYEGIEPDYVTPHDGEGHRTSIYGTPLAEIRPTYLERQAMFRQDIGNAQGWLMLKSWFVNAGPLAAMPVPIGRVGWLARGANAGKEATIVYRSVDAAGNIQYVGITNDIARRAAEHLRGSGIMIEKLMGNLSRADARAVEQALIEIHGLGRSGGTLLNRINSISPTNPSHAEQLRRGYDLLKTVGY